MMYVVAAVEPEAPMSQVPDSRVNAELPPAHVSEMVATEALPEPVLVRVRKAADDVVAQVKVLPAFVVRKLRAESAVPVTATWAEFWPWAKIPKTKPPTATEAIIVTAMTSTVAMIGEMALRLPCLSLETRVMAPMRVIQSKVYLDFVIIGQKSNSNSPQDQNAVCVFGSKKRKVGSLILQNSHEVGPGLLPSSREEELCAVGKNYCPR